MQASTGASTITMGSEIHVPFMLSAPNIAGAPRLPTSAAKPPIIAAYGACVTTCSGTSQSAESALRMVVSLMGLQWSPQTLPASIAAKL